MMGKLLHDFLLKKNSRGRSQYCQELARWPAFSKQLLWLDCLYNLEELRQRSSHEVSAVVALLGACAKNKDLFRGSELHEDILRKGMLEKCLDALVTMYAKCGGLAKAQQLFGTYKSRDPITWTALIAGYVQNGQGHAALNCFECMRQEGLFPDEVTLACILTACGDIGASDKGEQIHDEIAKHGLLKNNVILGNALVNMYAKCGALVKARKVLEELPVRNVISWNVLITGYNHYGEGERALDCFEQMMQEGLCPNAVTFTCMLNACGSIRAADKGEQIHNEVAKQGLLRNKIALGNALVDMYAKCGALTKAYQVLKDLPIRNTISWSAIIAGYAQHGQGEQALSCLDGMLQEGLSPNAMTYSCILKACGSIGAIDKGEQIHDEIVKQGMLANNVVLGTALVDMYAKCGALIKAQQTLEELSIQSIVSWNALIGGYAQQGKGEKALECFEQLQLEGPSPDAATYSCLLTTCSCLGLVEAAQMYFANMTRKHGMKPNLDHYCCMVNLFGHTGYLDKAVEMVEDMPCTNSGIWYSILDACRKWGDVNIGRRAFQYAVEVDKSDAGAYILMANIYSQAGRQYDAENIEIMRLKNQAGRKSMQSG